MTTRQDRAETNGRRAREASEWAARHMMDRDFSAAEIAKWKDWLSHPENSAEYAEVVMLIQYVRSQPMPVFLEDDKEPCPSANENSVDSYHLEPANVHYLPAAASPLKRVAIAAALVLALVYCGYLSFGGRHPDRLTEAERSYVTVPGRSLSVNLSDGSVITMRGNTVIKTQFSPRERLVVVERGEAVFQVERDPRRAFRVVAQVGSITAVGTEFDIRCYASRVLVTVMDGAVEVGPREASGAAAGGNGNFISSAGWAPVRVSSNQVMTYSVNGVASPAERTDAFGAIAWIDGELRFENEPLREVVEDIQRSSQRQFVVEGTVPETPYTGTIMQGHLDQWLKDLKRFAPVKVIPSEQGPTVLVFDAAAAETKK